MTDKESSKEVVFKWIMKSFSLPLVLLCLALGIALTIIENMLMGPFDNQEIKALIALNVVICLLISFLFKHLTKKKSFYEHGDN
ncbi:MAG: hypothetical protein ACXWJK_04930 [Burkholderiaceae bacterium]